MEMYEGGESGGGANWEPKLKRTMKTPSQLEFLEKTYAMETYPSEALRAELSFRLGLSDRQLQMWFCHRRLKDKKAPPEKKQKKNTPSPAVGAGSSGGIAHEMAVADADVAKDTQQKNKRVVGHKVGTAVPRISTESPPVRRFYEPTLAISEQRAIRFVEAQLREPLKEDGPILGMEFDPLPPGAFGAPVVTAKQKTPVGQSYDPRLHEKPEAKRTKGASKALQEHQFLPSARNDLYERTPHEHHNARVPLSTTRSIFHSNEQLSPEYLQSHNTPSSSVLPHKSMPEVQLCSDPREVDVASMVNATIDSHLLVHPISELDDKFITPERRIALDQERLERKRKSEEVRVAKEVEFHEKRIKKELEKQDFLRKKREEQMRKEMQRQYRERRKEEERLLRERQREEERCQREHRREMERREKFLQKEYIRVNT